MHRMNEDTLRKSPSIILVEDEEQQREVLRMVFESEGYELRCVASAEEALQHIQLNCPDIVVSDVKLPGIDGFTLFEKIREHPEFQKLPFVFITGYNDPQAIARLQKLDSVGYITKPYDIETLITVVGKYVPSIKL